MLVHTFTQCAHTPPLLLIVGRSLSFTLHQVLYYLSGLTCTDENFIQKAGAQRTAALRGVALVVPDTSPRGAGVEGEVGVCLRGFAGDLFVPDSNAYATADAVPRIALRATSCVLNFQFR